MTSQKESNAADYQQQSDDVFGRIANRYDRLSDFFSFGVHRLWKRKVASIIVSENREPLLDAATGTGDIVLRVLRHKGISVPGTIVASDINARMLELAKNRIRKANDGKCIVRLLELDSENLHSIDTGSFDCYSMSLGLKICNREAAMREAYRILKPGGTAVFLEASNIPFIFLQSIYIRYMELCMPLIGWMATGGDKSAYQYLLAGIKKFPNAEDLRNELHLAGFDEVKFERLSLGIVAIHRARKPEQSGAIGSRD